jgi:glycosyltransferase involved in cell wall biosynthesis
VQSIANLVKEFHQGVEYFIFCSDIDLNGAGLDIKTGEWVVYNGYTRVWYAEPGKISDSLLQQVTKIKPDILYITGLFSWHFNIVPLVYCKAHRKILSTKGMLHPGALSQKKFKKKLYLQLWKITGLHHRCEFHATDEQEKKYIEDTFGKVKIHIAQNFPKSLKKLPPPEKITGSLKLVSIALISPMKNILLVLEALRPLRPQITYDIYGPVKDQDYWNLCLHEIEKLPPNIIVNYHGDIPPTDVEHALSHSHVFILPSKSENFGHAIYEALSAGKPVITSDNTPWKLLEDSKAGFNISLDSPALSDAITFFVDMNQEEYDIWSSNAANYATDAINFEEIQSQYKKMFAWPPSLLERD